MSYNKLGFTSGQTLKAEHLNYMEDGIANAGRGLKILEAATIEELYDKIVVLDNPIIFKVTTDGDFDYRIDGAPDGTINGTCSFVNANGDVYTYDGITTLVLNEFYTDVANHVYIGYDGEELSGEICYMADNAWATLTNINFSDITKFTVYYF